MKNPIFDALTRAIDARQVVMVTDEAGVRMIEPYLIFESAAGDIVLHGWQRSGAFRTAPPPRFCNLHLDDLHEVKLSADGFEHAQEEYNPDSSRFHRVIYALAERVEASPPSPPAQRTSPATRRRPPSRQSDDTPRKWGDRQL